MENATKALLIAAGFMLAIVMLSLFILVFGKFADSSRNIYANLESSEINEFNQKFLNFEGENKNKYKDESGNEHFYQLTMQDVMTMINLSKDNTESGKLPVHVMINIKKGYLNLDNISNPKILDKDGNELPMNINEVKNKEDFDFATLTSDTLNQIMKYNHDVTFSKCIVEYVERTTEKQGEEVKLVEKVKIE